MRYPKETSETPMPTAPTNIDSYIANQPAEIQPILQKVRETVHKAAPKAEEILSYGMPCFSLNGGNLVYFAPAKKHLGFYPTPSAIAAFQKELAKYDGAKGSVQFPWDKPIPYGLIGKMVKFRVKESNAKAEAKAKKKK
jgi:uncharacterized protein YdhG (YjbR/CyaY superfamily)